MNRLALLTLLAAAVLLQRANAGDWRSDSGSNLRFSANAQGEDFEGGFARFSAQIRFDPAALDASLFEVEIDLRSVDSRNSERDEMLADPAFFDSQKQAQAQYRATQFVALDDGRFRAEGELTLRGVAAPVPLDFEWSQDESSARLVGSATLDRLVFDVGGGEWADPDAIAHSVKVMTSLQLTPAVAATP